MTSKAKSGVGFGRGRAEENSLTRRPGDAATRGERQTAIGWIPDHDFVASGMTENPGSGSDSGENEDRQQ